MKTAPLLIKQVSASGFNVVQSFLAPVRTGKITLVAGILLGGCLAVATPYNGNGPGESTIGVGGDYASLYDACAAISAATLTGGDWTFNILNDLSEPRNCSLVQPGSTSHTISLRPAAGVNATVTFTITQAPPRLTTAGHLTVGAVREVTQGIPAVNYIPTHYVTIDGSNIAGGTSCNLTFKNTAGVGAQALIAVSGNCESIIIKNCNLDSYGVHASYGNTFVPYPVSAGIEYGLGKPIAGNPAAPRDVQHYGRVENCHLRYFGNNPAAALNVNTVYSEPVAVKISRSFTCAGNTMTSFTAGVNVAAFDELTASGNLVEIDTSLVGNTGLPAYGIFAQPLAVGSSMTLSQNGIKINHTGKPTNIVGIHTRELQARCSTFIDNNMISGDFSLQPPGYGLGSAMGIHSEAEAGSTVTLRQNSVAIKGSNSPADRSAGFYLGANPGSSQLPVGYAVLRNNIIRAGMPNSVAVYTRGTSASLESNHNCLYAVSGAYVGRCAGAPLGKPNPESLQWWQQVSGQDLASINLDPYQSAGAGLGTWAGPANANDADLHFTTFPGSAYQAEALPGIVVDIDSDPRGASLTLMGADEVPDPHAGVHNWTLY